MTVRIPFPENDRPLWVFAYGSLMWKPGFTVEESREARLFGYHRSLCVWSHVHRGTPEHPGLVFGLQPGGSCHGRLLRTRANEQAQVLEYLADRELVTDIYLPRYVEVAAGAERIRALTFVVDTRHYQFARVLDEDVAIKTVASARGQSGHSLDYLESTLAHLKAQGIASGRLQHILAHARNLARLLEPSNDV
ncbi:gamma-glutamylcyclotransferase [Pokkaliibacter sp. CJK22405]|uniref:gamma-glutamylcyclotransferase n=1 Tax=Pokkaliibacter sp. CJK22405 TaxID=3384615 RepID=UPI00398553D2